MSSNEPTVLQGRVAFNRDEFEEVRKGYKQDVEALKELLKAPDNDFTDFEIGEIEKTINKIEERFELKTDTGI